VFPSSNSHLQKVYVVAYAPDNQVGGGGVQACRDFIHEQGLGRTNHQLQCTAERERTYDTHSPSVLFCVPHGMHMTAVHLVLRNVTLSDFRTVQPGGRSSGNDMRVTHHSSSSTTGAAVLCGCLPESQRTSPVVTRLRCPPDTPRLIWLPTMVSAHTCRQ